MPACEGPAAKRKCRCQWFLGCLPACGIPVELKTNLALLVLLLLARPQAARGAIVSGNVALLQQALRQAGNEGLDEDDVANLYWEAAVDSLAPATLQVGRLQAQALGWPAGVVEGCLCVRGECGLGVVQGCRVGWR